jgi:hypothetical protein
MRDSRSLGLRACALAIVLATAATGAQAASSGTALLRLAAGSAGTNNGDFVSDTGGLATTYRFYIQVPPGQTQLVIDVFDADFGVAGAGDTDNNRDRQRGGSFDSALTYRLFNPAGGAVTPNFTTGDNAGPAGADNAWLNFETVNNPAAGHWLVEMDASASGGNDVNAFGIRAHDGTSGAGGTEFNIYAESYIGIGVNAITGTGTRGTTFTLHPYVTEGCTANHKDFDYDSTNALTVDGEDQRAVYTNRTGNYSETITNANLSGNDTWANVTLANPATGPAGTSTVRDGLGMWTAVYRINEFAGDNSNYVTLAVGDDGNATIPPTAQPEADTRRIYLPTDAGGKPDMPYITQRVFYESGENPPAVGGPNTVLRVTISVENPGAQSITFSATNFVRVRVPNFANSGVNYVGTSATVSQGTIIAQPGNNANGVIDWNPGTVAGNSINAATLTYRINAQPTAGGTYNVVGSGNTTNNSNTTGTRMQFVDNTGNTTQARATYAFGGLCPISYTTGTAVPTPVTLSWVKAVRSGGEIAVDWSTDSEYRNIGFDIYGRSGDNWVKLNTVSTRGRGESLRTERYSARVAAAAEISEIAIEDIAADGKRTRHPGVRVGAELGRLSLAAAPNWNAIRTEADATARGLGVAGTPQRAYLDVASDGIYRVSVAALNAAGTNFVGMPHASLALTDERGPVPLRVINPSGAQLGADSTIEFIGRARKTLYSSTRVYLLSVNPTDARRIVDFGTAPTAQYAVIDSYPAEAEVARNLQYSFASTHADPWYDTRMLSFDGQPQSFQFTVNTDNLVSASNTTTVAAAFWGGSDWPGIDNDHRLRISVNGTDIATYAFPAFSNQAVRYVLPDGLLQAGANTVTLTQTADIGASHDLTHVERVALSYAREFVARNGALDAQVGPPAENGFAPDVLFGSSNEDYAIECASAPCGTVNARGFAPSSALTALVGNNQRVVAIDGLSADAGGNVRLVVPRTPDDQLTLMESSRILAPGVRAATDATDLATPPADLLVISHPNFANALGSFVAARQAQGLSVRVVGLDAVYARYSAGQTDPEAIRALLRDAYPIGTRYALLVGGDTYDYHNYSGAGAVSFVPTLYAQTDEIVRFAPADALFGDIDGDQAPEVAVGRWPVRNASELATAIAKTLAYDSATHSAKALFVAGGAQADFNFSTLSQGLAAQVGAAGWTTDLAHIDAQGVGGAQNALISAINQGRALVNFVGHSSVDRWTFDPLLLGNDVVGLLNNANAPTVVTQWGCWSNYFVSPSNDPIGVKFLFDTDGGAAAVIGAGTLVQTQQQDEFMRLVLDQAAVGNARLGDALNHARREFGTRFAERRDMFVGINLLGDPTLKLRH